MTSKFVGMAQSPSKMVPFQRQTSRSRGIFHKPAEELPKMQPGHSTASGYWPTPTPPSGWEDGAARLRAEFPSAEARERKHASKNEQIAYLTSEINRLRAARVTRSRASSSNNNHNDGGGDEGRFFAPQRGDSRRSRPVTADSAARASSASSASSYRPPSRDLGSYGMRQWEHDVFAAAQTTGYPRVGRPRTPTVSHEVLWSEMPNSLYRSHAVERVQTEERARIGTGRRAARLPSRNERRGAVPVSIPYM